MLGPSGGGKTRLGVMIEQSLGKSSEVHRVPAHRSLTMNTKVQAPTSEVAERRLRYGDVEAQERLDKLKAYVMDTAQKDMEEYAIRLTQRRVDEMLKKISLPSSSIADLESGLKTGIAQIHPTTIYAKVSQDLKDAIAGKNYPEMLRLYDNKRLLAEAAKFLELSRKQLERLVNKTLPNKNAPELLAALKTALPTINI